MSTDDPRTYQFSSSRKARQRIINEQNPNNPGTRLYQNGMENEPKNYSIIGNFQYVKSEYGMRRWLFLIGNLCLFCILFPPIYSYYSYQSDEAWDKEKNSHNIGVNVVFSNGDGVKECQAIYLWFAVGLLFLSVILIFYLMNIYRRLVVLSGEYDSKFGESTKTFRKLAPFGTTYYPWISVLITLLTSFVYFGIYRTSLTYKERPHNKDIIATGNGKNFPVFYSETGTQWYQSSKNSASKGIAIGYGSAYRNSTYYVTGLGISSSSNIMKASVNDLTWEDYTTSGASFNIGYDIACGNSSSDPYLVAVGEGKDQIIYRNTNTGDWAVPTTITLFNLRANGVAYGTSAGTECWVVVGENSDGTNPIKYSTNLTTWTDVSVSEAFFAKGVEFGLTGSGTPTWIVTGRGTNTFYYAENNPTTWTPISTGDFFTQGNNVRFNPQFTDSGISSNFWLATGVNEVGKSNILYSNDPTGTGGWSEAKGDLPSNANDVTQYTKTTDNFDNIYGKNIRVAAGSYPNIVTSDYQDGIQWTGLLDQEKQATIYSLTTRNPKYPLSD